MSDLINRIMIGFVAAFAAACVGIIVYQVLWAAPAARCEKSGGWWDPGRRECGKVVYIPDLTGRYRVDGREHQVRMPTPEQLARERRGSPAIAASPSPSA